MENKDEELLKSMHFENKNENCAVNQGVFYGSVFALPGSSPQITNNYGKQPKNNNNGNDKQDGIETAEAREKRKTEVMKAITDKFDFTDEQLGFDHKKRRLTNDKIGTLFRRCFGMGYTPPTPARKAIIEQLWTLLIDERNQCSKEAGEGYFRQTVLNIIGYYAGEGLLCGMPRDLARAIFPKADSNIAKNVSRGIGSPVFPEGLDEILDHYIDQILSE